jgi:hypothetical protein
MAADQYPDSIAIEFLTGEMQPISLRDLGEQFLLENGIDLAAADRPFRIAVEQKHSKAGNVFYEYSQHGVPLPDGLNTYIRVEGVVIPMGRIRPSKQKGYPTREGTAEIVLGATLYKVTAYLTEGKSPFYVRLVAHKKPSAGQGLKKAMKRPRGGRIVT